MYDFCNYALRLTKFIHVVTGPIFFHHLPDRSAHPLHCVFNLEGQKLDPPWSRRSFSRLPEETQPKESVSPV